MGRIAGLGTETAFSAVETIGGHFAGPVVAVCAFGAVAELLFSRLQSLPTLPWLRGRLHLIRVDELGCVSQVPNSIDPDEIIMIEAPDSQKDQAAAAESGYWDVLRLCASLGMIEGRGIVSEPS